MFEQALRMEEGKDPAAVPSNAEEATSAEETKEKKKKRRSTYTMCNESGETKEKKRKEISTDAMSEESGENRVASLTESQPPVRRSAR